MRRVLLPAKISLLGLLAAGVLLGGCAGVMDEQRSYYMQREWNQFTSGGWHESVDHAGFDQVMPTATQKEVANEKKICEHPNSGNRVMEQDGVNDTYNYRHCVLAPYQTDAGQRMGNRPDGIRSFEN